MIEVFKKKLGRETAIPIIIITFYLLIVFYNFFEQGLINYDEAFLLIAAHTYSDIGKTLLFHPQNLLSSNYYENLRGDYYGNVYTAARPIYILAASIIDAIWKSEYSTRFLNIITGAFIILFFYRILGLYQLNRKIKTTSSILLVASPLFLIYSRVGLSQILSAFFLITALFYLLKFSQHFKREYLIFSALSTSFLLMSHLIVIPIVLTLIIYSMLLLYRNRAKIQDYLIYFLFIVIFPLIWEAITWVGVLLARTRNLGELSQKMVSYSGEIITQSKYGQGLDGLIFDQTFYYFKLLFSSENLIIIILLALGLIFAVRNIKQAEFHLILLLIFPFLATLSLLFLKFPRNIIPILPLFYLIVALGLRQIYLFWDRIIDKRKIYLILSCLVLLVIFLNMNSYLNIFNIKTNVDKITSFIKQFYRPEDIQIYASAAPIWRAYLPGYSIELLSKLELNEELETKDKQIIVISDYYTRIGEPQKLEEYQKKLLSQYSTNIFKVKPVILDFFYREEEYMNKLFADKNNINSITEVYQIQK